MTKRTQEKDFSRVIISGFLKREITENVDNFTMNKSWADEVEDSLNGSQNKRVKKETKPYINQRKKPKSEENNKPSKPLEMETNPEILQRRQKQIDYGKNTVGYQNFIQQVRFVERTKNHPKTPEKYLKYSRRSWDTLIKIWRKKLHEYDTEGYKCNDDAEDDDDDDSDNQDIRD